MHQDTPAVSQNNHAVAVPYLLEQVFHDRSGMADKIVIAGQGTLQFGGRQIVASGQPADW